MQLLFSQSTDKAGELSGLPGSQGVSVGARAAGLLAACQALRTAIAAAAGTVPGTGPGRGSFTIALNTRDQVILAASVAAGPLTSGNKTSLAGLGVTGGGNGSGPAPARFVRIVAALQRPGTAAPCPGP